MTSSDSKDPSQVVREGYNRAAARYLAARARGSADLPLAADFARLLPTGALVLDAGCGAGVPVTRFLAQSHRVVGVDFSIAQVRMARQLVPTALFTCQDMAQLAFPPGTFDGVCSFYAILHIPRVKHEALLSDFFRLLKATGAALLCLGAEDVEADRAPYLGVPMFWSHFDADTYLAMLTGMGFQLVSSQIVPDPIGPNGSHLFALVGKDCA